MGVCDRRLYSGFDVRPTQSDCGPQREPTAQVALYRYPVVQLPERHVITPHDSDVKITEEVDSDLLQCGSSPVLESSLTRDQVILE